MIMANFQHQSLQELVDTLKETEKKKGILLCCFLRVTPFGRELLEDCKRRLEKRGEIVDILWEEKRMESLQKAMDYETIVFLTGDLLDTGILSLTFSAKGKKGIVLCLPSLEEIGEGNLPFAVFQKERTETVLFCAYDFAFPKNKGVYGNREEKENFAKWRTNLLAMLIGFTLYAKEGESLLSSMDLSRKIIFAT